MNGAVTVQLAERLQEFVLCETERLRVTRTSDGRQEKTDYEKRE